MPPKEKDESQKLEPVDGWPVLHYASGRVKVGTAGAGSRFASFMFRTSTYPGCDTVADMVREEIKVRNADGRATPIKGPLDPTSGAASS
jgi:hypothetical protein